MTKIPTEVLKLAIEGGWEHETADVITYFLQHGDSEHVRWQSVALDREFWIALFPLGDCHCGINGHPLNSVNCPAEKWTYKAHDFYDLTLRGQDPTEFWNELLANQKGSHNAILTDVFIKLTHRP